MKLRKPAYFDQFSCIGSACTDSCCAGWEIEIDETTAEAYEALPGPFGDRLREKMTVTPEESFFALEDNRCPFLNGEGLCEVILTLGEGALCDICREHPRFYHWYEDVTEVGLGMCCEEAVRLMFASPAPMRFVTEEIGEEPMSLEREEYERLMREEEGETKSSPAAAAEGRQKEAKTAEDDTAGDANEEYLAGDSERMQQVRESAFFILQDRSFSLGYRMQHLLDFACRLQQVSNPKENDKRVRESWKRLIALFARMEALSEEWPKILASLNEHLDEVLDASPAFDRYFAPRLYEYEHLAVYFTYRYFPESLYDGNLLSKVEFIVSSVLMIYLLDIRTYLEKGEYAIADRNAICRRFSREVEYCPDNLELFEEFCLERGPAFIADLTGMLTAVRS